MRKRGKKVEKMGRAPCCNKGEVKKGAWTPEEDKILVDYITKNGHGTWRSFPKLAGLQRCGKSCRLRWTNYLRPDIKRGAFSFEEEETILELHSLHGNKWAAIASRLPGRTDNEIKNYWNSHLRKRIPDKGHARQTNSSSKSTDTKSTLPPTRHTAEWENTRVEAEAGLSLDPMLRGVSDSNNFLYAWGSGLGEEFQKPMDFDKVASVIPTPQPSSATKVESDSVGTAQAGSWFTLTSTSESCDQSVKEHMRVKDETEEAMNVSISQSSYEAENSSDLTLDLLLDFPNDGEYLEYV